VILARNNSISVRVGRSLVTTFSQLTSAAARRRCAFLLMVPFADVPGGSNIRPFARPASFTCCHRIVSSNRFFAHCRFTAFNSLAVAFARLSAMTTDSRPLDAMLPAIALRPHGTW
jgi:hypothetical protein